MWSPLLEPGLALLSVSDHALRQACHHLALHAVHSDPGVVVWLDGEHGFRPPDTPAGEYLAPLLAPGKRGRAKVIDLTPLGRKVASRIRAGGLPA